MHEIAESADVARATVFNHFSEKDELLRGYIARRRAGLIELLGGEAGDEVDAARRI
jgi:AcrR family transcriptional regulator